MTTHASRIVLAAAFAGIFAATISHAMAPAGRYTTPSAGVVYDTKTKLTWQKGYATSSGWGSVNTSGTAQNICAALTSLDGGGWRVPTIGELQSLVDYSQVGGNTATGMIDPTAFPGTPGFEFWSSTPVAGPNGGSAWAVQFYDGSTIGSSSYTSNGWDVRCVK